MKQKKSKKQSQKQSKTQQTDTIKDATKEHITISVEASENNISNASLDATLSGKNNGANNAQDAKEKKSDTTTIVDTDKAAKLSIPTATGTPRQRSLRSDAGKPRKPKSPKLDAEAGIEASLKLILRGVTGLLSLFLGEKWKADAEDLDNFVESGKSVVLKYPAVQSVIDNSPEISLGLTGINYVAKRVKKSESEPETKKEPVEPETKKEPADTTETLDASGYIPTKV